MWRPRWINHAYLQYKHRTIYKSCNQNNAILQSWAHDLVIEDEDTGIGIWQHANNISLCNRAKELQFR